MSEFFTQSGKMQTNTIAGPPSAGKTAVIMHAASALQSENLTPAADKFDTRSSALLQGKTSTKEVKVSAVKSARESFD